MSNNREWTIGVRPADRQQVRKIMKIVGLNGGGFSVITPYHNAQSGLLCKMPIRREIHKSGVHDIPWSSLVAFTAEDRVKLSYHTDGFAQFSAEKAGRIISGRDPVTGEPKGLGLFTHRLATPIWSGPSVGVTFWGIHDFAEARETDDPIVFEPGEFYYRGCTPEEANGWILSIYVFPESIVPPVRFRQGQALLDAALEGLGGGMRSMVQLKVVNLRKERVFLGFFINRCVVSYPSKSGWILNGPGDYTLSRNGHVLLAFYPRDVIPTGGLPSLDRSISTVPPEPLREHDEGNERLSV